MGVERLRELICALGRLRSLRDPIARAVEELGLTPAQVHTVIWLGEDGPLTMGELSRRVGITGKTIPESWSGSCGEATSPASATRRTAG